MWERGRRGRFERRSLYLLLLRAPVEKWGRTSFFYSRPARVEERQKNEIERRPERRSRVLLHQSFSGAKAKMPL